MSWAFIIVELGKAPIINPQALGPDNSVHEFCHMVAAQWEEKYGNGRIVTRTCGMTDDGYHTVDLYSETDELVCQIVAQPIELFEFEHLSEITDIQAAAMDVLRNPPSTIEELAMMATPIVVEGLQGIVDDETLPESLRLTAERFLDITKKVNKAERKHSTLH